MAKKAKVRTKAWIPATKKSKKPSRKFGGKVYRYHGNAVGGAAGTVHIISDRIKAEGKYYIRTIRQEKELTNIKGVKTHEVMTATWDIYIREKPSAKQKKPKTLHGILMR